MIDLLLNNNLGEGFCLPQNLKARCMRSYGWDEAFTDEALQGYLQFMKLKIQHEDWDAKILCPSVTVDLVWRLHVLDIEHYKVSFDDYCGSIANISYDPDGDLESAARDERIKTTKISLTALFGRESVDSKIWSFESKKKTKKAKKPSKKRNTDKAEKTSGTSFSSAARLNETNGSIIGKGAGKNDSESLGGDMCAMKNESTSDNRDTKDTNDGATKDGIGVDFTGAVGSEQEEDQLIIEEI